MNKKILLAILLILGLLAVWQRELIGYGLSQAKGQLMIVQGAKPIEEYLSNPQLPDTLRVGLEIVQAARRFAFDSLGVPVSDNYTTFYDQHGKNLLWVITASKPYELKPKQWTFPFVGTVSYKGFFNYDAALAEETALKEQGYEVLVEEVNGWSSLGWFKDPILSNMLKRSEGGLASLIIHELTHEVLYVKDSTIFNENLATFIGEQGALRFLKNKYGENTYEYQQYANNRSDYSKYAQHILKGAVKLDSLYATFSAQTPEAEKLQLKEKCIANIIARLDTVSFHFPELYLNHFMQGNLPNNTYFLSYRRYRLYQAQFEAEFREKYHGNLKLYLADLAKKYPHL